MTSVWPSAIASLDNSLVQLCESLRKLEAATVVDVPHVVEQLTEQFKRAAESAQNVRGLVCSELPDASWQSRAELDVIVEDELEKEKVLAAVVPSALGSEVANISYPAGD